MRQGVGAGLPHREGQRRAQSVRDKAATAAPSAHARNIQTRTNISRLFMDLRGALRITPYQVAAQLVTGIETIEALETGQVERLPPWPETARIVMAYTGVAGIDGRPVLAAIADILQSTPVHAKAPQRTVSQRPQVERLRQAGTAFARGARRLPKDAFQQVRQRPERALYAVSLPLGIVLLLLNTSVLQAAFNHVPRPVVRIAQDVRQFFQETFAPVHEGLRWIDVDDPRRRRGDKLQKTAQSD